MPRMSTAASAAHRNEEAPEKHLAALLDEMFAETREQFRTYGRVRWAVTNVTAGAITVTVEAQREADGIRVSRRIKNAMLGLLKGMIPCPTFRAIFSNRAKGVSSTHRLKFYGPHVRTRDLPGNIIWLEENAARFRREWRPRIQKAWRQVVARRYRPKGNRTGQVPERP